jgi:hypothetical protein
LCCQTGQPQLVRTSVYSDGLEKEQQKNRCFHCQRFGNLSPGFPGSQSLNLLVIRTRAKSRQPFTGDYSSFTDAVILQSYRPLVKAFSIFQQTNRTTIYAPDLTVFAPLAVPARFFLGAAAVRSRPKPNP